MKKKILITLGALLAVTMTGCKQQAIEKPVTETNTSSEVVTKESSSNAEKVSSEKTSETKIASVEDVVTLYQKQFADSDITSIKLENERSGFVYKVEGVDDNNEYELKINAESKDTIKDKTEKLDKDEQAGVKREADKLDLTNVISLDKATEIAEKEAKSGKAVEWELDRELSTTYWEVQIKDGNKEYKVKLDAKTGDVLQVEMDD
ncbi:MAG: PepSY domain-containing protein [Vagococcus sp.]|uniref:PepSY domain-containing protein n=1 Tax=Vagococcus TaxID=2737 RepID=UPI002FC8BD2D